MALQRYRPGARLPAVRTHNARKRGAYRFSSAAKKKLYDPSTRMFQAMLVFSRAVGRYAGQDVSADRIAHVGMDAVFTWWCKHGPRGTAHDKREVGAQIAADAAEQFGFDDSVIEPAITRLMRIWATVRCRNGRPARSNRVFSAQNDSVVQNERLTGGNYRFAALPLPA